MYFPIGYGFGGGYWIFFFLIPMILGGIASAAANARLKKYSQISNSLNISGAQAASDMMASQDVHGVNFYAGADGQDFYDPRNNSITLSENNVSVTAIAVACHEAGHACQHAQGYWPVKFRTALVPVVNLMSNAWIFILLAGFIFNIAGLSYIAVIAFAATLLFHLVTLPVELNASSRAISYLGTIGLQEEEMKATKRILRSCAFTYVVAALISALQLLWVLAQQRRD